MVFDPRVSIVGLIVGTLVGLTGIGGGSLMMPLLILVLGVKPSLAVGTDLLVSVPTKLLAFFFHARRKTIDWAVTRALVLGGIPGALGGLGVFALARARIPAATLEALLRHAIGIAILLACLGAAALWIARSRRSSAVDTGELPPPGRIAAIGALVGFLVTITSIGSGSITLPLLVFAFPAAALRRLIGSEIAFAAFLVPVAAFGHASFGNVDYRLSLGLLAGALPGVWIGSRLATLLDDGWLRPIVLGALAIAGSRLV